MTSRIVVLGAVILPLFASPARGQSRLHPRWVIPGFDFRRDGGWRVKARGVAAKAKKYGVQRLPAIVIDEKLAACCANRAVDEKVLHTAGVGVALAKA